jgi:MFS superfamily sulfate permease-like transporter
MHELSERTKHLLELVTIAGGIFTAVTLNQVAVTVTIIAGIVSAAVGCFRLYDRIKYGPRAAS